MEEIIIYVAGSPDDYPFEYYDEDAHAYQGIIPELLREFSANSQYDIRYYGMSKNDMRETMGTYHQVDVLSGVKENSTLLETGKSIPLFSYEDQDGIHSYQLVVLAHAPSALYEDLATYLGSYTQQELDGRMVEFVKTPQADPQADQQTITLILLIVCLVALVLWLLRKYHKQIQAVHLAQEQNIRLHIGNRKYLSRKFRLGIKDENRILYCLFYFDVKTKAQSLNEETAMLVNVISTISKTLNEQDILGCLSDHQLVCFHRCMNDEVALALAKEVLDQTHELYEQNLSIHVGIYRLMADDWDLDEVLALGEYGMELAQRNKQGYQFCGNEHVALRKEQRQLCLDAIQGLEHNEFQMYIQWYADSEKQQILGGEALSRWQHPLKGILEPAQYIPLLEKEHMIYDLDMVMLQMVCDFLEKQWQDGVKKLFISCNLAMETICKSEFFEACQTMLASCSFPHEQLILEIKGTYDDQANKGLVDNLRRCKEMGIKLVLDGLKNDLTLLQKEELCIWDGLKLDRSLIRTIGNQTNDVYISSLIQMGHRLHMTMMAEGVETKQQANLLKKWHCDVMQGFFLHKPTPLWEVERILREKKEICI